MKGSSGEYWTMGEILIQQSYMGDVEGRNNTSVVKL